MILHANQTLLPAIGKRLNHQIAVNSSQNVNYNKVFEDCVTDAQHTSASYKVVIYAIP